MPPSDSNPNSISDKIAELQRLQKQVRFWRSFTIIAIIAIVVGCLGMVVHKAHRLSQDTPEQREFVQELSSGLQSDVLPDMQRLANQTVNDVVPALKAEMMKMGDRMPAIVTEAKKELGVLSANVQSKGEKTLDDTFGEVLKKREAKIHEMYPDVDEKKIAQLVENMIVVGDERMKGVVNKLFAGHIDALDKITESMEAIRKAEAPHIAEETPTWEMALLVFDIFREDIRDLDKKPEVPLKKQ